nr:MAG TPA: hypothetical protein [Crassvirales sp.]
MILISPLLAVIGPFIPYLILAMSLLISFTIHPSAVIIISSRFFVDRLSNTVNEPNYLSDDISECIGLISSSPSTRRSVAVV